MAKKKTGRKGKIQQKKHVEQNQLNNNRKKAGGMQQR
jgi:hypothetical protein